MIDLPRTTELICRGITEGLHVGAQLYTSRDAQPLSSLAIGEARPDVPMADDALVSWMSCSKPVGAVAMAQLRERGVLDFDDRVGHHIPEFAANGKDAITIQHLLTHTSGLRPPAPGWENRPWDEIIAAICATSLQPGWAPGEKAGYSAAVSWYVLGEIIRRADGRAYDRYVRDEIFEPLGMHDAWIGMPAERYRAYGQRIALMPDTTKSPPAFRTPAQDEIDATHVRPGGGGRGPARQLVRFYEMLLAGGENIVSTQGVRELTARHRIGMFDNTFRHVMDWGLGFIVNSAHHGKDVPYGFGDHASAETFGHGGAQSSSSFADPKHGLAVAIVWNGTPGEAKHHVRARATLTALYEDLGFTS